jgi:hypothetical protein
MREARLCLLRRTVRKSRSRLRLRATIHLIDQEKNGCIQMQQSRGKGGPSIGVEGMVIGECDR